MIFKARKDATEIIIIIIIIIIITTICNSPTTVNKNNKKCDPSAPVGLTTHEKAKMCTHLNVILYAVCHVSTHPSTHPPFTRLFILQEVIRTEFREYKNTDSRKQRKAIYTRTYIYNSDKAS
jgi:hypothetical protein